MEERNEVGNISEEPKVRRTKKAILLKFVSYREEVLFCFVLFMFIHFLYYF